MSGRSQKAANTVLESCELYNDAIGQEALARSGNNPQLKGIVHEMLFRDQQNLSANGLVRGNVSQLTKNPTAHGVDVVTINKQNHVTGRYQLKDCTSQSGVDKTLSQVRSGKYRTSKLMGTSETKRAYDASKSAGDKTMHSSGVSSKRTGRIADNAGVSSRDSNTVLNNFKDIGDCAANGAAIGAAFSCAGSAISNFSKVKDGTMSVGEYAANVACDTATAAVESAATTAAALTIKEGGKALAKQIGGESLKRLAGSNVATATAFGIVEMGKDAIDLARGEINGEEFGKRAVGTVGGTAGGLGGASAGAALGTAICPGVGTAIGALVGGIAGGLGGRSIGDAIGDFLFG